MSDCAGLARRFLVRHPEKGELNQYWYSEGTLASVVDEILSSGCDRVAFLSTPSVFFCLPKGSALAENARLFDLDDKWASLPQFVRYDFSEPTSFGGDAELEPSSFDGFVIDPPFITREVWEKYAETVRFLGRKDPETGQLTAKVLASTIPENADFMDELLGVRPCAFKPSIPHLVYQYCFYTSYEPSPEGLGRRNPEIHEEEDE